MRHMTDRQRTILDAAIGVIARDGVRGLRVERVAEEAGVAVSLLYYYFRSRNGLVRATLEHANERAAAAAPAQGDGMSGRDRVEATLLADFGADAETRDTSVVWGEVLASAVFQPDLREQLRAAAANWTDLVASAIEEGVADGSVRADVDARACAERLTALVEGLSARWLAGLIERERARELVTAAVLSELRPSPAAR
jgi:AcrR family transcriptional regulator